MDDPAEPLREASRAIAGYVNDAPDTLDPPTARQVLYQLVRLLNGVGAAAQRTRLSLSADNAYHENPNGDPVEQVNVAKMHLQQLADLLDDETGHSAAHNHLRRALEELWPLGANR